METSQNLRLSPIITSLSNELLCHIIQFLPLKETLSIAMLCRKLATAVDMHLQLCKFLDFSQGKIFGYMPSSITDDHVHCLLRKCPKLEVVYGLHPLKVERRRLRKRSSLTVPGIIEALCLCPHLKGVETCDLRLLEAILQHLPQLEIMGHFRNRDGVFPPHASQRLKLQPYPRVTSLHLIGVEVPELTAMPHLEHLYLQCVRFTKLQPFRAFLAQNLKSFVMKHCMGPSMSLRYLSLIIALSSSPFLTRLELVRVPLPGGLFQRAVEDSYKNNGFVNLKTLVIAGCKGVLESDLGHLMIVASKNLETVCIQPSLTKDSLFVSLSFAQCDFSKLKNLQLGYVDKFHSIGEWSNDVLLTLGLAEVPDVPSSLTDSGMKVISQLFPNVRSMSVSNCPHLMALDLWSPEGVQVWKELTDFTLQRCHCLRLPSFALFLALLPKIETVILEDMFREPPKGCSHVGLSAGTGLGMSSAVVSNQDEHIAVQGHQQDLEPQVDDQLENDENEREFVEVDEDLRLRPDNHEPHLMVLQQDLFNNENGYGGNAELREDDDIHENIHDQNRDHVPGAEPVSDGVIVQDNSTKSLNKNLCNEEESSTDGSNMPFILENHSQPSTSQFKVNFTEKSCQTSQEDCDSFEANSFDISEPSTSAEVVIPFSEQNSSRTFYSRKCKLNTKNEKERLVHASESCPDLPAPSTFFPNHDVNDRKCCSSSSNEVPKVTKVKCESKQKKFSVECVSEPYSDFSVPSTSFSTVDLTQNFPESSARISKKSKFTHDSETLPAVQDKSLHKGNSNPLIHRACKQDMKGKQVHRVFDPMMPSTSQAGNNSHNISDSEMHAEEDHEETYAFRMKEKPNVDTQRALMPTDGQTRNGKYFRSVSADNLNQKYKFSKKSEKSSLLIDKSMFSENVTVKEENSINSSLPSTSKGYSKSRMPPAHLSSNQVTELNKKVSVSNDLSIISGGEGMFQGPLTRHRKRMLCAAVKENQHSSVDNHELACKETRMHKRKRTSSAAVKKEHCFSQMPSAAIKNEECPRCSCTSHSSVKLEHNSDSENQFSRVGNPLKDKRKEHEVESDSDVGPEIQGPLTRNREKMLSVLGNQEFISQGTQATSADIRRSLRRQKNGSAVSRRSERAQLMLRPRLHPRSKISLKERTSRSKQSKSKHDVLNKATSTSDPLLEDDAVQTLRVVSETLISLTVVSCGISDIIIDHCHKISHVEVQACRILKKCQLRHCPSLSRLSISQCPKIDMDILAFEVMSLENKRSLLVYFEPCMQNYNYVDGERAVFTKTSLEHGVILMHDFTFNLCDEIQAAHRENLLGWLELFRRMAMVHKESVGKKKLKSEDSSLSSKFPWGHQHIRRIISSISRLKTIKPNVVDSRYQILTNNPLFAKAYESANIDEGFPGPQTCGYDVNIPALTKLLSCEIAEWKETSLQWHSKFVGFYVNLQEGS